MALQPLNFYFTTQDPEFNTTTTGVYYGKTGNVSLFPKPDGSRIVNITFNT